MELAGLEAQELARPNASGSGCGAPSKRAHMQAIPNDGEGRNRTGDTTIFTRRRLALERREKCCKLADSDIAG